MAASRIQGITVEIGGDTTKLTDAGLPGNRYRNCHRGRNREWICGNRNQSDLQAGKQD